MKVSVTIGLMLMAHAAAQTSIDLRTQSRNVDFSGSISTKPVRTGTALPAACSTGEMFFRTDAVAGKNLFACTATNTWTILSGTSSGGGGGTWLNGPTDPSSAVGADGDYYLNSAITCLYGPKAAGAWPASCTSLIGPAGGSFSGNPAYDGMLGLGPGGSTHETGWRAPQTLSTSFYFGLPDVTPAAKSLMVFTPPVARAGNDPAMSSQVSEAALYGITGNGASVPSIDANPAEGCATLSGGKLTGTGAPCGSGGGGGTGGGPTLAASVARPLTGPGFIANGGSGSGPGANSLHTYWYPLLNPYASQSIGNVAWFSFTGEPGKSMVIGIYDASCTLVSETGTVPVPNTGNRQSAALTPPAVVTTPYFYIVYAGNCATCSITHYTDQSTITDGSTGVLGAVPVAAGAFRGPDAVQSGSVITLPSNCATKTALGNFERLPPVIVAW